MFLGSNSKGGVCDSEGDGSDSGVWGSDSRERVSDSRVGGNDSKGRDSDSAQCPRSAPYGRKITFSTQITKTHLQSAPDQLPMMEK
jgi:hypothetical protein